MSNDEKMIKMKIFKTRKSEETQRGQKSEHRKGREEQGEETTKEKRQQGQIIKGKRRDKQ